MFFFFERSSVLLENVLCILFDMPRSKNDLKRPVFSNKSLQKKSFPLILLTYSEITVYLFKTF